MGQLKRSNFRFQQYSVKKVKRNGNEITFNVFFSLGKHLTIHLTVLHSQ